MIEIIFLALLAGIILLKLGSALGRKTGHERPRANPYAARNTQGGGDDNVVRLPNSGGGAEDAAPAPIERFAPAGSALAQGLTDIQLADRTFDPQSFLEGAKGAYEMIITAYAEGDRKQLKALVDPEVYEGFAQALDRRDARGERQETTFIGISKAEIKEAGMDGRQAEVTVKFVSELISVTKNADGAVIEGDPTEVQEVTDRWTFARDTRTSDPNWKLIGTSAD